MNDSSYRHLPLVSVLVPSYNHARFIDECLDSVRDEDWPFLELLIVDDASSDDCYQRATAWVAQHGSRFARVEIVRHEVNRGVGATMNELVAMSRGEYLVPLASDDLLIRGGISQRLEALNSSHSPQGAVIGDAWLIDEEGHRLQESAFVVLHRANMEALRHARTMRRELILNWSVPGPVLMFHRNLLEAYEGKMYLEGVRAEDRDLYLRIMARDALVFVDAPVAWYRQHSLSASALHTDAISYELVDAEREHAADFPPSLRFLLRVVAGLGQRRLVVSGSPPQRVTLFALRTLRKCLLATNAISASRATRVERRAAQRV
ncbi:glycosyltransferase [Nocardioides sp. 616]|uniref:glycosyltransferase family 2 protein n=1 Tax=Nocardioides sp. 616 TaxID=2268090 RepID=UPI0013B38C32|nr:glycosyltransferase [Nocardioides sp. 616]